MMEFFKKNFYLILFGAVLFGKSEFIFADIQSGNNEIDSLIHVLKSEKSDKIQIELINKISWIYLEFDFNNGIKYADSALKLSQKINWDFGIAEAYNNYGLAYRYKGEISPSIEYHNKALNILLKNNEKVKIAETYGYLGISYFNISSFPQAFNYFEKSLKIYRDIKDEKGIAKCLSYIGILHSSFGDFTKALDYFIRSLNIEKKLNNKNNIAVQLGNIATTYYELKDYKNALIYFNQTLKELEAIKDYYNYSTFLFNTGRVYAETKKYNKAREYYLKSLSYVQETGDQYLEAFVIGELGNLNLKIINDSLNKIEKQEKNNLIIEAIEKLKDSEGKFSTLGIEDERKTYLFLLSQAYKEKGDYLKALETFAFAKEIQDSIYSKENKRIIAELEIKQQLDMKEKEIEILNKEKENEKIIQYSLIGFVVVFVFISGGSIFYYIKTKKDNRLLHENIITRKAAEKELREYHNNLEQLVSERTKKLEEEIDERNKIENALIQSEEKYRMLVDFAVDGFFQGDMNGNFITVNKRAAEQTGYSKEELLKMNMRDLFSPKVLKEKPLQYDLLKKVETFKTER